MAEKASHSKIGKIDMKERRDGGKISSAEGKIVSPCVPSTTISYF